MDLCPLNQIELKRIKQLHKYYSNRLYILTVCLPPFRMDNELALFILK